MLTLSVVTFTGRTAQERAKKRDSALREIEVWSSVNHPGIVNLIEFFVDSNSVSSNP
jgi:serine/threonine protein kinase